MDEELFDPSCSACERAQEDFAKQEKRIAELERERIDSQAQLMVERRELLERLAAAQATIQRMLDEFDHLRIAAEESDSCHYGTLSTTFVRDIAAEALALPNDRTTLDTMLADERQSTEWYKRRCDALQEWQSKMRDPERTIVCDILANGFTLDPANARDRYAIRQAAERGE